MTKEYSKCPRLGTTRSACAVDLAVEEGIDAFVIGNAPTALFRILELVKEGKVNPKFIVGVPVDLSVQLNQKRYLKFDIPSISTVGYKGVQCSCIYNKCPMYMVVGR